MSYKYYPIIKFSSAIENAINSIVLPPSAPKIYNEFYNRFDDMDLAMKVFWNGIHNQNCLYEEIRPDKPPLKLYKYLVYIFLLLSFFSIFQTIFLVSFLIFASIFYFIMKYSKKEYKQELLKFLNIIERNKHTKERYLKDLEYFNQNKQKLQKEHVKNELKSVLSKTIEPNTKLINSYSIGISEDYFENQLKKHFSNKIYKNITIDEMEIYDGELKLSEFEQLLLPDFVYWDKENKVCIDIEIDEVYVMSSKKPIHYINEMGDSIDSSRNDYFNDSGWIVVRFSENQIINFPDQCCKIIQEIVKKIKCILEGLEYDDAILKDILQEELCWDINKAKELAKINYRDDLLKKIGINYTKRIPSLD